MQYHANEAGQHGNATGDTEQCRKIRSYGGHVWNGKDGEGDRKSTKNRLVEIEPFFMGRDNGEENKKSLLNH